MFQYVVVKPDNSLVESLLFCELLESILQIAADGKTMHDA
jgi:hypothetical protein